jgi:hypothetical protein
MGSSLSRILDVPHIIIHDQLLISFDARAYVLVRGFQNRARAVWLAKACNVPQSFIWLFRYIIQ